jgi:hypothetical protein
MPCWRCAAPTALRCHKASGSPHEVRRPAGWPRPVRRRCASAPRTCAWWAGRRGGARARPVPGTQSGVACAGRWRRFRAAPERAVAAAGPGPRAGPGIAGVQARLSLAGAVARARQRAQPRRHFVVAEGDGRRAVRTAIAGAGRDGADGGLGQTADAALGPSGHLAGVRDQDGRLSAIRGAWDNCGDLPPDVESIFDRFAHDPLAHFNHDTGRPIGWRTTFLGGTRCMPSRTGPCGVRCFCPVLRGPSPAADVRRERRRLTTPPLVSAPHSALSAAAASAAGSGRSSSST